MYDAARLKSMTLHCCSAACTLSSISWASSRTWVANMSRSFVTRTNSASNCDNMVLQIHIQSTLARLDESVEGLTSHGICVWVNDTRLDESVVGRTSHGICVWVNDTRLDESVEGRTSHGTSVWVNDTKTVILRSYVVWFRNESPESNIQWQNIGYN